MTSDSTLADDLFRVAERTTDDGRVEVQIRDVSERGESYLRVTAQLPHGGEMTESLEYPERDSPDYKFVRLVERAGYSLGAIEELEGTYVEAEKRGKHWVFYAPETTTRRERFKERFAALRDWDNSEETGFWNVFAWSWLLIPAYAIFGPLEENMGEWGMGYTMAVWNIILWMCIAAGVWHLLL